MKSAYKIAPIRLALNFADAELSGGDLVGSTLIHANLGKLKIEEVSTVSAPISLVLSSPTVGKREIRLDDLRDTRFWEYLITSKYVVDRINNTKHKRENIEGQEKHKELCEYFSVKNPAVTKLSLQKNNDTWALNSRGWPI